MPLQLPHSLQPKTGVVEQRWLQMRLWRAHHPGTGAYANGISLSVGPSNDGQPPPRPDITVRRHLLCRSLPWLGGDNIAGCESVNPLLPTHKTYWAFKKYTRTVSDKNFMLAVRGNWARMPGFCQGDAGTQPSTGHSAQVARAFNKSQPAAQRARHWRTQALSPCRAVVRQKMCFHTAACSATAFTPEPGCWQPGVRVEAGALRERGISLQQP